MSLEAGEGRVHSREFVWGVGVRRTGDEGVVCSPVINMVLVHVV